jgi:hypothetical protein
MISVPPVKDDLLHVRFSNIGIHMVNTPPNIQGRIGYFERLTSSLIPFIQ